MSTREKPELRSELLKLGVSQLSAASRTYPGGYADMAANKPDAQQFWVGDERSLAQVIQDLVNDGFIPSFCTGCYRHGRTGDHFMGLAKTSFIKEFCTPNAITSFAEYLYDHAPADLRESGMALIETQLDKIDKNGQRERVQKHLKEIADGKRDVHC
jgi:2-iminoacetate synthase